ncbi:cytosolic sulfotransferase 5-like [Telopea speciosissima]|uniref:cytosolic sulfotransferase 5-like n=1 Tax=Telopea speciosissima TaxID=54955 RepID=UPI001CC62FF2|nr:cytosolic sulfotransferase 5-like [Telopea speciosissima]
MAVQNHFKAFPTDILVATTPKSGTIWLKSLVFATMNRKSTTAAPHSLLLNFCPHDLVPCLEQRLYLKQIPDDIELLPIPRVLATHMPYTSLPHSVLDSGCRIIYLSRNPKDTFVSYWHFVNKVRSKRLESPLSLEEAFEMFCNGTIGFGPFWDHVLGYWKASLERPNCVLFLKFEELQLEPAFQLKRVAEFMGCPFSYEEEKEEAMIDDIVRLCSFENLRNLEVTRNGATASDNKKSVFFRQGKVGDWENHLKPEMIQRLDWITEQKWKANGLVI